jgi:hypothetical protein
MNLTKRTKLLALGTVALLALPTISACGVTNKAAEPLQDSKISQRYKTTVVVYDNADGFSNVSEFCDNGGNMVIVPFHDSDPYTAIAVIPNDPRCKTAEPPRLYYQAK